MITEDYVSFETAKLLKEKGFDGNTPCKYAGKEGATEEWYDDYRERMVRFNLNEGYLIEPLTEPQDKYCVYGDTIPAPTLQMAMKWLREVHKIHIQIWILEEKGYWFNVEKILNTQYKHKSLYSTGSEDIYFDTYEEACEAAIKYCLEHLI